MNFYTNVKTYGNRILVRGIDKGARFKTREDFKPTLFLKSNNKTKYKTLNGEYVEPIQPGSIKDCKEFYNKYSELENFKIYGNERYLYQYISEMYPDDEIKYDFSLIKTYIIDIEVESENGFPDVESVSEKILLITIKDLNSNQIHTWGKGPYYDSNVNYRSFSNEYDLLSDFIHWWSEEKNTPDIVSGWNSTLYDIPYITRRIDRVLGEKYKNMLSPWGLVSEKEVYTIGRKHISYDIQGISQLDYLDLYKKFTYKNQESYRLDYIAEVELDQRKLDHSEFDTFKDFYTKDWKKFVSYNIIDVQLVDRLEDKMKLIDLAITMAYDAKVNYEDIFSQVRMWDTIIYNYLKKRNIVIPPKASSVKTEKYAGAFVKEPIPGVYDWIVSFDLTSLYPSLIMGFNISPETLIENKHPSITIDKVLNQELTFESYKDYSVCANGSMYRKDIRGFLPELMEKIFKERSIYKKKMLEAKNQYEKTPSKELEKEIARCTNIQMARKVQLNSAYGSVGNNYFRYYKLENAEAITLSGQVAIRWIENKLNQYLNKILKTNGVDYVIAVDTDSVVGDTEVYINSEKIKIEDIYDNVCNESNLICKRDENDYIHNVSELSLYTKSYDGENLIDDKIIHIMKHKVKKKFYKVTVNENEVILTEDHSLIVERCGKLISVKPQDVIEDDIFVNIDDTGQCLKTAYKCGENLVLRLKIECLGEIECDVYDLETAKTNKFFGNDILIHNSVYLNMGSLVETVFKGREKTNEIVVSFLDKICKVELEKYIESCYQELADYVNAYEQRMKMKREIIAERGIWTAKKRYILNVWDSEGVRYEEPKLKMMGIEAIKSSTPAWCRKMLKKSFKILMTGNESDIITFIDNCREEFKTLSPEQIAFPRTASDVNKYSSPINIYMPKCPIQVRGALLFNHYIKKNNLTYKYSLINNGEKVKYVFLKKPNIIHENVIAFIQDFPRELGLDKYVDYDLQFEKSFLDPLKSIMDTIGWNTENKITLDSLFI